MRIPVNPEYYLSPFSWEDVEILAKRINDPEIYANTLEVPFPYTQNDARKFIIKVKAFEEKNNFVKDWAIRDVNDDLIGGIGFHFRHGFKSHKSEIGYWLYKKYRGMGIMPLAIEAMSKFGFEQLSLVRIEAMTFANNPASGKALEKAGFSKEGFLKKSFYKDGNYLDGILYAKVKE